MCRYGYTHYCFYGISAKFWMFNGWCLILIFTLLSHLYNILTSSSRQWKNMVRTTEFYNSIPIFIKERNFSIGIKPIFVLTQSKNSVGYNFVLFKIEKNNQFNMSYMNFEQISKNYYEQCTLLLFFNVIGFFYSQWPTHFNLLS